MPTGPKGTSARVLLLGLPTHANDDEAVMAEKVASVKAAIQRLMDRGLQERRGIFV